MGVPTIVLASHRRRGRQPDHLDHDANDKSLPDRQARTQEGFYRVNGLEQTISRGVAYALRPRLVRDRRTGHRLRPRVRPGRARLPRQAAVVQLLAVVQLEEEPQRQTDLPSRKTWRRWATSTSSSPRAGIHSNWYNTFASPAYARGEGMRHYVKMIQEPEFAARDLGYTFVSHQQEVGAG